MSSGQKSCNDDEDDWNDFKNMVGLGSVPWKVYSREAGTAQMLYKKLGSTGLLLKLDVLQLIEQEDLDSKQKVERKSFIAAQELVKKYS